MNSDRYLAAAADQLRADGNAVGPVALPGGQALVGYQSQFRWQWMATRIHLFTILVPVPVATDHMLERLVEDSFSYAIITKGGARGFQSGLALIPVLVAEHVTDEARAAAVGPWRRKFGAFAAPAVVDLERGEVLNYQGRVLIGRVYAKWLRTRVAATLPNPAAA